MPHRGRSRQEEEAPEEKNTEEDEELRRAPNSRIVRQSGNYVVVDVISRYRSMTHPSANKCRKVVLSPGFGNYEPERKMLSH